jgi:hypothetical protein
MRELNPVLTVSNISVTNEVTNAAKLVSHTPLHMAMPVGEKNGWLRIV